MSDYIPYEIRVSAAESWMERPIRVELTTPTPNGSTTSVFYLDHAERDALVEALSRV